MKLLTDPMVTILAAGNHGPRSGAARQKRAGQVHGYKAVPILVRHVGHVTGAALEGAGGNQHVKSHLSA
jgi:hypothetical protein